MSLLFLISAMSSLGLMPTAQAPPRTCSLSGKIEVLGPNGKLDPRVAKVYVNTAIPDDSPPRHHRMVQDGYQFWPRLMMIKQRDFIDFLNKDSVSHEVHSKNYVNLFQLEKGANAKDTTHSQQFMKQGVSIIGCNLHDNMHAAVLTVPNSFNSDVDAEGKWVISGLKQEPLEVVIWVEGRADVRLKLTPCVSKPTTVSLPMPQEQILIPEDRYKRTE